MNKVISIGYGRPLFEAGNIERGRLAACAEAVGHLDVIIFSKKEHGLQTEHVSSKLSLHATNSRNNLTALFDAFFLARRLVKQSTLPVTLTTQDPFETALIGILIKKLYDVKLIIQEHGDFFGGPYWRRESFLNQLRFWFGSWSLLQADVVRVVSKRTEAHMKRRGVKTVKILPVAIDTQAYQTRDIETEARALFKEGTFVFLSTSRFVPQKNLPLLLNAFIAAYAKHPEIRLLLVGSGPKEGEVASLLARHPVAAEAVKILPWSAGVAKLMRSSDAYLHASNYEGWGRVHIEAMLSGLPIVTTDVGCVGEVVQNNLHGLVVPVDDEAQLIAAIVQIVVDKDLYQKFKTNLASCTPDTIPGTDSSAYPAHWAAVFGG